VTYPNPPRTWVAGAVATAAQFNSDLRDALNAIIPTASTTLAWASWTPTLTQSGNVTKTVTLAKYFQIGKIVVAVYVLTVTGTGTGNNVVTVSLPVTGSNSNAPAGAGWINDGGGNVPGLQMVGTTTAQFIDSTIKINVFLGQTGSTFSAALTAGMAVNGVLVYQAA
jgi:hypothetical protein